METLKLTSQEIASLDSHYRRNLFNTISGFKAANLIGTVSPDGVHNLAIFNSVVHIGANPPYLGFILRPTTVPRHTYQNLKANGYFTINAVPVEMVTNAHQTSAKYEEGTSEFDTCGFTVEDSSLHPAPYVAESPVKIGLSWEEEHPIKANGTIMIVGKVIELFIDPKIVAKDGFADLEKGNVALVAGLDAYFKAARIGRFAYARPGQAVKKL